MSLGGCYLEMKQDVFHYLIQQNKSLQEYVNKNSLNSCTLEQSWDSVRILTQNFSPNILGSSLNKVIYLYFFHLKKLRVISFCGLVLLLQKND